MKTAEERLNDVREIYFVRDQKMKEKWERVVIDGEATNYFISNRGALKNDRSNILIPHKMKNGYLQYQLSINGKIKHKLAHRLVAEYFCQVPVELKMIGYTKDLLTVNHRDGIKNHNDYFNLEWTDIKGNNDHALKFNLKHTKLDYQRKKEVIRLLKKGMRPIEIAKNLGVERHLIYSMAKRLRDLAVLESDSDKLSYSVPYKYDEELVKSICEDLQNTNITHKEIAERYGVLPEYVTSIHNGSRRSIISKNYNFDDRIPKRQNPEFIKAVCEALQNSGKMKKEIAEEFGISQTFIAEIINGTICPDIGSQYDFNKNRVRSDRNDDEFVHMICKAIESGMRKKEICEKYNTGLSFIDLLRTDRVRPDITKYYDFPNSRVRRVEVVKK